ncbi:hypothetical protein BOX15_Mlig028129g1 [Macrostomum lignano]|uniref:Isochorismatase domain-containing protein n=2 Tax=Macrostomum lignano TaxID=282301 RepID=A0A1I8HSB8_9PLAT|nr:hypothetical protein BOX15_Mlig028129g1 [Macrostomum lignano]
MASAVVRCVGKLNSNRTALFLCDMQEKFRKTITHFPAIVDTSSRMLRACQIMKMPVFVTEQYPKGLGHTVPELGDLSGVTVIDKTQFSMCVNAVMSALPSEIDSVLLCGIEAHACVQQTSLDLLEKNFQVHVIVDAVSSRNPVDRMYALDRMKSAGCWLTTSESAVLALLRDASHPHFKEVQKIIWEPSLDSGLLQPGGREPSGGKL